MRVKNILFALSAMSGLAFANDCNNINNQAKKIMMQNQITGMAIAIVNQNKVEFCNYGYTNKNKKIPITNKSIFEIASITKTFTALLAGIAVSENKLDLNAPITKYIPELMVNQSYTKINSKELLTHVSGLPLGFDKADTEKELLSSLINMKFTTQPGVNYQYSNSGITISGIAIMRAYNNTYQNLLNTLILNKLEMKYTSIDVNSVNKDLIVTGYNKHDHPVGFMNIGVDNPAGGLKSNTYDLAKYLQFQMNASEPNLQQALSIVHTNYYCLYENGTYQQLAWEYHPPNVLSEQFQPDQDGRNILPPHQLPKKCKDVANGFIDKNGNSIGMTSYIGYLLTKKIGVVILSNSALKPDVVNLGRYVMKNVLQLSKKQKNIDGAVNA